MRAWRIHVLAVTVAAVTACGTAAGTSAVDGPVDGNDVPITLVPPSRFPPPPPPPPTGGPATTAAPPTTAASISSIPTAPVTVTPAPTTPAPTTPAPTTTAPTLPARQLGPPPIVDAAAWAAFDPATDVLLGGSEADVPRAVGSLMKLVTALVVMEAGEPQRIVTAPSGLIRSPDESAVGVYRGERLRRGLLLEAMLIASANDAARALAVDIASSEEAFALQMSAAASALGLRATHAVNATGLDASGNESSAHDMVVLADALMTDPQFAATVARTSFRLHDQVFPSTNDLLTTYPGADGVKTGRTTAAGWCIVASAGRDGRRVIVAVLGAPSETARDVAASELLDWALY